MGMFYPQIYVGVKIPVILWSVLSIGARGGGNTKVSIWIDIVASPHVISVRGPVFLVPSSLHFCEYLACEHRTPSLNRLLVAVGVRVPLLHWKLIWRGGLMTSCLVEGLRKPNLHLTIISLKHFFNNLLDINWAIADEFKGTLEPKSFSQYQLKAQTEVKKKDWPQHRQWWSRQLYFCLWHICLNPIPRWWYSQWC